MSYLVANSGGRAGRHGFPTFEQGGEELFHFGQRGIDLLRVGGEQAPLHIGVEIAKRAADFASYWGSRERESSRRMAEARMI